MGRGFVETWPYGVSKTLFQRTKEFLEGGYYQQF